MLGLPITFAAPLALAALVALPALWFLLRVTPPRPRRIDFPPLRIMADLLGKRETPARTPPWLLILRILAAACLILAVSGPVWNPSGTGAVTGRTPLMRSGGSSTSVEHAASASIRPSEANGRRRRRREDCGRFAMPDIAFRTEPVSRKSPGAPGRTR